MSTKTILFKKKEPKRKSLELHKLSAEIPEKRMKNSIVVNSEADWQEYLPGYEVQSRRIQNSSWLYHQNTLWVLDASGGLRVDGVL